MSIKRYKPQQAEGLQCVLKAVIIHSDKLELGVVELEDFALVRRIVKYHGRWQGLLVVRRFINSYPGRGSH